MFSWLEFDFSLLPPMMMMMMICNVMYVFKHFACLNFSPLHSHTHNYRLPPFFYLWCLTKVYLCDGIKKLWFDYQMPSRRSNQKIGWLFAIGVAVSVSFRNLAERKKINISKREREHDDALRIYMRVVHTQNTPSTLWHACVWATRARESKARGVSPHSWCNNSD